MAEEIETNVTDTQENVIPGCTCNDEFCIAPCPVHAVGVIQKENGRMVISDEHMVSDEIRNWTGHTFTCPECGKESIMYFMKNCGDCGAPIIIKSVKLTNFMKSKSAKE